MSSPLLSYVSCGVGKSFGFVHPSLLIAPAKNAGRGVLASLSIPKGTVLIKLNRHQATSESVERRRDPPPSSASASSSDPDPSPPPARSDWLLTITALLRLLLLPATPYTRSLPANAAAFNTLLSWSESERAGLESTSLRQVLPEATCEAVIERFESRVRPALPEEIRGKVTKEQFLCAALAVSTRGFHTPSADDPSKMEGPFLLPLIDMLNHDPMNPGGVLSRDDNGDFLVTAVRDIREGEELTHSYGPFDNAALLRTYGFVVAKPPMCSPVLLGAGEVVRACRAVADRFRSVEHDTSSGDESWDPGSGWDKKEVWLRSRLEAGGGGLEVTFEAGLTDATVTCFAGMMLESSAFSDLFGNNNEADNSDDLEKEQVAAEKFLGKLAFLAAKETFAARLAGYPNPLSTDEATVKKKGRGEGGYRGYCAATVRLEEMRVLHKLTAEVQKVLAGLGVKDDTMNEEAGGGGEAKTKKIKLF